jgi:hypothetical protein
MTSENQQLPAEPLKADTLVVTVDYQVDADLIASMLRENQRINGAAVIQTGDRWGVFIPYSEEIKERLPSLMHYSAGASDAIQRALGRVTRMKGGDDESAE